MRNRNRLYRFARRWVIWQAATADVPAHWIVAEAVMWALAAAAVGAVFL